MATLGHFNMTFYDSLGVFKTISRDFDFFEFVWTPPPPKIWAWLAQYGKNLKNMSKSVFWGPKCCQELSKSAQNTLFPCSNHFLEVCIGFPVEFWLKKVYKLDFRNFEIFGHSDLVLQIWKSLKFGWKMKKNTYFGARNLVKKHMDF